MDGTSRRRQDRRNCRPAWAMLYVDDAHGEGVLGEGGGDRLSLSSHARTGARRDGTFLQGVRRGRRHISGSEDLVRFALNKSRTWLLSGSHPPAVAAACTAAIDVLEQEPEHVRSLWNNTNYFKKAMGSWVSTWDGARRRSHRLMMGDTVVAKRLSQRLFEERCSPCDRFPHGGKTRPGSGR